jgi:tripartite-type tricarboxylate transporter receptor subunit TctC
MIPRRALLLAPLATPALAQQPMFTRPIRIVIPVVAGGGVDAAVRTLTPRLSAELGQPVVLDNRPGGAGVLAADIVAHAPADGHTLLLGTVGVMAVNPTLFRNLSAHPVRDFTPVSLLVNVTNLLAAPTDRPFKSVAELVAALKAAPGRLSYGSAGIGAAGHLAGALLDHLSGTEAVHIPYRGGGQLITDLISGKIDYASSGVGGMQHLGGELLVKMSGVKLAHVPYKGGPPAFADVVAGRVPAMISGIQGAIPQIKGGKVRGLAVTGKKRAGALPELTTVAEALGLPDYEVLNWQGLLFPPGTPAAIVERISAEVIKILGAPDSREKLESLGYEPIGNTPAQAAAVMAAEQKKWTAVIREAGISSD